ncbi:MAG: hypothetical protein LC650_04525 [Actinobacteria bacterium]|nr:hypothetical protein [Actinomycetota bacterium]
MFEDCLEEEVGTCYCPDCKEGAVVIRVQDTPEATPEFRSNCCYATVDTSVCYMN